MNNEQLIMNNDGMLFCEKLLFDSSTVQQCIPKSFIIHHSSFITQPQGGC